MILFTRICTNYIKYGVLISFLSFFIFKEYIYLFVISSFLILLLIVFIEYFFWKKSYFLITNEKIAIKVRNWFFSKYHMILFYKNIKDMAYSKNNFFHYMFDYGTFFARSSAWSEWDFIALYIPKVEEVYKIINFLYLLDEKERKNMTYLESSNLSKKEDILDIIEKEKKNLLSIKGIKEVIVLDNIDKKYIFETEEDRNHGVYECLKKNVLFCITHDSNFRQPDNPIVLKLRKKIIFPTVNFHEIQRASVISSSPWIEVHNYLIKKFKNVSTYDATILIGFDI